MKRFTRTRLLPLLLAAVLLFGCCGTAFGAAAADDFRYTSTADGVTLTAYTGSAASLTIPAEIDGKPVVAIGDGCFDGLLCLKRVTVPEGVTRIGDYAFECCGALQRIYLPASLTEIGKGAFSGCANLTLCDLQDGVQRIGDGAFLCCDALVYLQLPDALAELGDFAFAGCGALASVSFGESRLKALPDRAFYGCASLTRVRLPETVTSIGKRAFSGCASMTAFYHPTALDSLGAYAFEGCEKLANVTVSAPVLAEGIFSGCHELKYLSQEEGLQRVAAGALRDCGVTDLKLPASVTEIEPGAFYGGCVNCLTLDEACAAYQVMDGSLYTKDGKTLLAWFPADPYAEEPETSFTVPDGTEVLESFSLAAAPLTTVQLPDSLREIHAYVFANTAVEDLVIPEGAVVDPQAFDDPDAPDAAPMAATDAPAPTTVETVSAAGEKSLYNEADYARFRTIQNADFDAWCEDYLAYNEAHGSLLRQDLMPYIIRYKGEIVPHYIAMCAVQNHDPDQWKEAASTFGDDFEQMYLMMDHGLFTELSRGKMPDDLVLYSGVYDSQLKAAAGTEEVPTQAQLIDAIGTTFSDPIMISTTTDPAVACGFGDTLFIIYASREAMEALGAVCIDAVVHTTELEILMSAYAQYRVLDVGSMTVTHQDPWDDAPVTEQRNYVRVELLAPDKPADNPFVDVSEGKFFYGPVLWAVTEGVTNGVDAAHFAPKQSVTRAQAVTFLWRAAGCPAPKSAESAFADVPETAYYAEAVRWAVEQNITNGISPDAFAPNRACTRAELVTLLHRYAGTPAPVTAESPFTDVPETAYYAAAVRWAVEQSITNGTTDTTFSPANPCTRAETVTFLYRLAQA